MWGVVQHSGNLVAGSVSIGFVNLSGHALGSQETPHHGPTCSFPCPYAQSAQGVGGWVEEISFPKMQMLSFILMESGLLMIRCPTHLPIYFPPLTPSLPLSNTSPPAYTCSLGTKRMLQSHLIGLYFRIQGHLECFCNHMVSPSELLLTVLKYSVLCR